jgi:hypothetical protein
MSIGLRVVIGIAAWLGFVLTRVPALQHEAWAHALLLFAALLLVPMALDLLRDAEEPESVRRWFRRLELLVLPAGLLLVVSCWLNQGTIALAAALPWMAVTVIMAQIGLTRIRAGGLRRELDGLCRDAALIFALIGGAWTLADRAGYRPLGFESTIVALTAVHFHYAGILLPLFAGLAQRELFFFRFASRAAVGVVLGVPAVAVGISATQLGAGPAIEAAAGCGLALAGMAVGILHVRLATELRQPPAVRLLLGVAGVSLFLGMMFAAIYAARAFVGPAPWLGIPQMRMLHGTINAIGFALCGVIAWRAVGRTAK